MGVLTKIANDCFNVKMPEHGGTVMTSHYGGPALSLNLTQRQPDITSDPSGPTGMG